MDDNKEKAAVSDTVAEPSGFSKLTANYMWDNYYYPVQSLSQTDEVRIVRSYVHDPSQDHTGWGSGTHTIKLMLGNSKIAHPAFAGESGRVMFEKSITGGGCSNYARGVDNDLWLGVVRYLAHIHQWKVSDIFDVVTGVADKKAD